MCTRRRIWGIRTLLIGGGTILWMGTEKLSFPSYLGVEVVDLKGRRVIPGLIDGHCHITGGEGEAGPASKVKAPLAESYRRASVTAVVGVLGTDDVTRSTAELVAAARALVAQGINAYCHTGGYHLPLTTLTGSVRGDNCQYCSYYWSWGGGDFGSSVIAADVAGVVTDCC